MENYKKLEHVKIIDNINESFDKYNKNYKKYLGYIEYLDIKVEIVKGINDHNLDEHHACLSNENISLDSNTNKLLAGHSVKGVFERLHQLEIGDTIKIVSLENEYNYIVEKTFIVDDTDYKAIERDYDLTLITCTINPNKRLIIKASIIA